MSPTLSVDLETFSSVDIAKGGLFKYVQAPDFQIMLLAYSLDGAPVRIIDLAQGEVPPDDLLRALLDPDVVKRAYNASFEWYCLSKALGLTAPEEWLKQWRCTMAHGLYCALPAGLDAASSVLGLPDDKRKSGAGKSLIRTFCAPCAPSAANGFRTRTLPHHEPEKWLLFKEYCKQDVVAEMEIAKRLASFPMPEEEQRLLWELDQRINLYGVAVDAQCIEGALHCSEQVTAELMEEARELTGLDNPGSTAQLKRWLNEELESEDEAPDLKKETVKDLLGRLDNAKAKRVLEIRQELAKTSVKKYATMRETTGADGRIRGLFRYYGASRTGRWSGQLVQAQNLPRNYLESLDHARECVKAKRPDLLKVIYGNIPDTLSQLLRTVFVPSPGHKFVVVDFAAIEARVLAWLAGEQWRLDVFASHGKIYEASASQMFGVPLERIKKGNPEYELRQKGKVAELAFGYGGSVGALKAMGALEMGLAKHELQPLVKAWRSANPKIVRLWWDVNKAAMTAVKERTNTQTHGILFECKSGMLFIVLPSGRRLAYVKPKIGQNRFGGEAVTYEGVGISKKWDRIESYGSKFVENIVQGIARDCLASALVKIYAAGYDTAMHIHDEVVLDVPDATEEDLTQVIKLMEQPLPWAPGLLLRADGFVTAAYYRKE